MSNWLLRFVFVLFTILAGSAAIAKDLPKEEQMIVRIAEIQVDRSQLEEYLKQARTVGAESVSKEPGVIAIFPMVEKRNPEQIRIVEIYKNEEAYKAHLQTPHFLKYKTSTLSMVKKLGKLCKIRNFSQSPFGGFIFEESDGNFPSGRN